MNRTIRAMIGAVLILVIAFSAISICQNLGRSLKIDITEQRIYTLSEGTKAILKKLHQPITMKLYYAKTAALKGPDQIRYFNNYYYFVRALLEEYVAQSNGMVNLEVINPRPFSQDEVDALQYGLRQFPITEEENFFFGLVVQTPFGVEKSIRFLSPDRQNFVEYDISYLIDTVITRQKRKIGILSSLPVMGQNVSGYMAHMMHLQNREPQPPWAFVQQLRSRYEVEEIPTDVNDINDVDILLVIHPKDLPEQTLFAIDQYILKGGRTIICVDPFCTADTSETASMQMAFSRKQNSDLNVLLQTWGLEMPEKTFAGDRAIAVNAPVRRNERPQQIIGILNLNRDCFSSEKAMTSDLNQVTVMFAGILREIGTPAAPDEDKGEEAKPQIRRTPLIMTTNSGNSWKVDDTFELTFLDPSKLMIRFIDGTEPVCMGYLVTGRFKSSFPNGIEVEVESPPGEPNDTGEPKKIKKRIEGLKEATENCAIVVFSDVDFITNGVAYKNYPPFGYIIVGDNSALMLNAIEELSGSTDLISIRSRGNFRRPFTVVDEIEKQAEAETAAEVAKLNAQIEGFNRELQSILASAKGEGAEVVGSSIIEKQRQLELSKREAQRELNEVRLKKRERKEHLGNMLRNLNMLVAPAVILIISILLGLRRSIRKRHYISHASDA